MAATPTGRQQPGRSHTQGEREGAAATRRRPGREGRGRRAPASCAWPRRQVPRPFPAAAWPHPQGGDGDPSHACASLTTGPIHTDWTKSSLGAPTRPASAAGRGQPAPPERQGESGRRSPTSPSLLCVLSPGHAHSTLQLSQQARGGTALGCRVTRHGDPQLPSANLPTRAPAFLPCTRLCKLTGVNMPVPHSRDGKAQPRSHSDTRSRPGSAGTAAAMRNHRSHPCSTPGPLSGGRMSPGQRPEPDPWAGRATGRGRAGARRHGGSPVAL